jgi:hypothetical protein
MLTAVAILLIAALICSLLGLANQPGLNWAALGLLLLVIYIAIRG